MNVVRLKKKNILVILLGAFVLYTIIKKLNLLLETDEELQKKSSPFAVSAWISCTRNIAWFTQRVGGYEVSSSHYRSVDILGPPGSGVEWLRYIIEQLTGLKTGSTVVSHPEIFTGEGHTTRVVAVMSHDVENISSQNAGIIMYRTVRETIRTHFAQTNGAGAFLEAPLQAYYGKEWPTFAIHDGRQWAARYKRYVATRYPVLIIGYHELEERHSIQSHLLRLSNFLRVPIRQSALECIMKHANEFPLKPRPLKSSFQPFRLLSLNHITELQSLENETQTIIDRLRAVYRPNV